LEFDALRELLLGHHELGVERALVVAIVSTLLDYVVCVGALGDQRAPLLHLPVDQLDLLFHFLQQFLQAALLEYRLRPLQVVFRLLGLRRVADHEQCANHFKSLRDVDRTVAVQSVFQLLDFFHFLKGLVDHAEFDANERNISLDSRRALVDQAVVFL